MQHDSYSYEGEKAVITPHCLYSSIIGNGNFVSHEMWIITDNATTTSYWVEEGAIADGSDPNSQYRWFWANYYPGATQIYVHYAGPSVSMDTPYTARIAYQGSNQWSVDVGVNGGSLVNYGTALYNPPYSHIMIAGTEYTAANDRTAGNAASLQFQRTDGTWTGWWGASAEDLGTGNYAVATMPSATEVDWRSYNC